MGFTTMGLVVVLAVHLCFQNLICCNKLRPHHVKELFFCYILQAECRARRPLRMAKAKQEADDAAAQALKDKMEAKTVQYRT